MRFVYSVVHRGVPTAPGLVFGLDKGGKCEGMAFRAAKRRALDSRFHPQRPENVTNTYHASVQPVKLLRRKRLGLLGALRFVVDPRNWLHAGRIPLETEAGLVRRSAG